MYEKLYDHHDRFTLLPFFFCISIKTIIILCISNCGKCFTTIRVLLNITFNNTAFTLNVITYLQKQRFRYRSLNYVSFIGN